MQLHGLQILLVEDDVDSSELLTFFLESRGAEVVCAASMAEALSHAERSAPRIVISDWELPDGDGRTLLSKLRQLPSCERTPTIALTGHGSDAARQAATEAGFDEFLAKPVGLETLAALTQRLTGAERSS